MPARTVFGLAGALKNESSAEARAQRPARRIAAAAMRRALDPAGWKFEFMLFPSEMREEGARCQVARRRLHLAMEIGEQRTGHVRADLGRTRDALAQVG